MSRASEISGEKWGRLVEAYRARPGAHTAAGKAAGCWWQTARRYWAEGGQDKQARPPIRDLIADEQLAARAKLAEVGIAAALDAGTERARELAEREAELAAADRGEHRKAEAMIARVTRENALAVCEVVAMILESAALLRDSLRESFSTGKMAALVEADPVAAMKVLRECTRIASEGASISETAVKLERLVVGEPTENVRHTFESEADAEKVIERAHAALARRRAAEGADVPALH